MELPFEKYLSSMKADIESELVQVYSSDEDLLRADLEEAQFDISRLASGKSVKVTIRSFLSRCKGLDLQKLYSIFSKLSEINSGLGSLKQAKVSLNQGMKDQEKDSEAVAVAILEEIETDQEGAKAQNKFRQLGQFDGQSEQFRQNLPKIDFAEAKAMIDELLRNQQESNFSTLFLLQNAIPMKGELLVPHILEKLSGETDKTNFHRLSVEATPGDSSDRRKLLSSLGEYLNLEVTNDDGELEKAIARAIVDKLQTGSVIVLEISSSDSLFSEVALLRWFVQDFWGYLSRSVEAEAQKEELSYVKLIGLIVYNRKLPVEYRQDPICCELLRELELRNWQQREIEQWLSKYAAYKPKKSRQRANSIYESSNNGVPLVVSQLLERELFGEVR